MNRLPLVSSLILISLFVWGCAETSDHSDADFTSSKIEKTHQKAPQIQSPLVLKDQGQYIVAHAPDRTWKAQMNRVGKLALIGQNTNIQANLYAWGRADIQKRPGVRHIVQQDRRIEYHHPAGLTEWYLNKPSGLEHGFNLSQRPQGVGPIHIHMKIIGGKLTQQNDQAIEVISQNQRFAYNGLKVWDANHKPLPAKMKITGANQLTLVVDDDNATYPIVVDPTWMQTQQVTASDGDIDDRFGYSVDLSGDRAIVGAYGNDDNGSDTGSAYIYERDNTGVWVQKQKLTAMIPSAVAFFGWSVSISGDLAIVGAYNDRHNNADTGAAYIFERDNTGIWSQKQKLTAQDAVAGDRFGWSVAISDTRAVVGAYGDDDSGIDSGSVYVFERDNTGAWLQKQKLGASDGAINDRFGYHVDIWQNRLIAGAYGHDGNSMDEGAAYLFEANAVGVWSQKQKLTAQDATSGDTFGRSVGLWQDHLIVGAPTHDTGGMDAGAAYIFEANAAGVWSQKQKVQAALPGVSDRLGNSVSISNNQVIIGAYRKDDTANDVGAAYRFERDMAGLWTQKDVFMHSGANAGDEFGRSVAIDGGRSIVGSDRQDTKGQNAGAVYFFEDPTANNAPAAQSQTVSLQTNQNRQITLIGTDADGDTLTYNIINMPANGALMGTAPDLTYQPNNNFVGMDAFTFKVNDGQVDSNIATVSISVSATGTPPQANNATITVLEDSTYGGALSATDAENDPLTYQIEFGATKGTVTITNNSTGAFTYVPNANESGQDSFTFKANDGQTNSNTATVNITITPVNDPPQANDIAFNTALNTNLQRLLPAQDIDGNNLTYSIVNNGSKGTATILNINTGDFEYVPNNNVMGQDSFTFQVNDGQVNSNTATVTINIGGANTPPVGQTDSIVTSEDVAYMGQLQATDVDNDLLTYQVINQPNHGSATIQDPMLGTYVYLPDASYSGPDEFTFVANDGQVDSSEVKITVMVLQENDKPIAIAGSFDVDEDTTYTGQFDAFDNDNDPLTFRVRTLPRHGSVIIPDPRSNTFTYTPNTNFHGQDVFSYVANDGQVDSDESFINVTVRPVNDPPKVSNASYTTAEDTSTSQLIMASDSEMNVLSFSVLQPPTNGTVSINADIFTYAPKPDFHGMDSFTIMAHDSIAPSLPATISIVVTPVNDPPVFIDPTPGNQTILNIETDRLMEIQLAAQDVDGDPLTYEVQTLPMGAMLDANNLITWMPGVGDEGQYKLTLSVSDGQLDAMRTITINVATRDDDGDGLPNNVEEMLGLDPNNVDSDEDNIPDNIEVGDDFNNPIDTDMDNIIDAKDDDSDEDGISDRAEEGDGNLETEPIDTDKDGLPNYRDTDSDDDGVNDDTDNCPLIENALQEDQNMDGIGDRCQDVNDRDGDGIDDNVDNCPFVSNPNQIDKDNDGLGNLCDPDEAIVDNPGAGDDDGCGCTTITRPTRNRSPLALLVMCMICLVWLRRKTLQ